MLLEAAQASKPVLLARRRPRPAQSLHSRRLAFINTPYRFSEVVHRLGRGFSPVAPATAGEQLRRRTGWCYLESGRRTNITPLRLNEPEATFDGGRTQSYSHAYSDAGTVCLALYELQPVTDYIKKQDHET